MARLILIEGIPGSGKTTLAKRLHPLLSEKTPCACWLEGAAGHPVEMEWHACLTQEEYAALLRDFPEHAAALAAHARAEGGFMLIPYRGPDGVFAFPGALLLRLRSREFRYTDAPCIPFPAYAAVSLSRWRGFAAQWASKPGAVMLESAFLQRPVQDMLLHYSLHDTEIARFLRGAAEALSPLSPTLFYLSASDVPATLARIAAERGMPEMAFPDSVAFWSRRQALERSVLPGLPFAACVIEKDGETPAATALRMAAQLGFSD